MAHPTHPKCPSCGKALFKSYTAAKVRPADPYRFCRNTKCASAGPSGVLASAPEPEKSKKKQWRAKSGETPKQFWEHQAAEKKSAPEPVKPPARARAKAKPATPPQSPAKPGEPEAVAKARARIRALIKEAIDGRPAVSVGLVLAIVNQETGNHTAANSLIEDFGLDKLFGLQKFEPPGEAATEPK